VGLDRGEPTFEAALKQAAEGIIYARGLPLTADQLRQLIGACPEDHEHPGKRRIRRADFYNATFSGVADFRGVNFAGTPASTARPSAASLPAFFKFIRG
jgi:hypothetical protein